MEVYPFLQHFFVKRSLPAAFVLQEALGENILAIAKRAGNKQIRVASKSVRIPAVLEQLLSHGPPYQGLMTYSPSETVFLSEMGFDDLLMAYPTMDAYVLRKLAERVIQGGLIRLMFDLPGHLDLYQEVAKEAGCTFRVCMDIDLSYRLPGLHFGVHRSSITSVQAALERAHYLRKQCPNLVLDAVMGYEAQIAGVGDRTPGQSLKNFAIRFLKQRSIPKLRKRRARVVTALRQEGFSIELVNGGGTGSIESTRQEEVVTEITAGSGFFSSGLFDNYSGFRHQPAAGYAVEITRNPQPGLYTASGGGYPASGAIAPDKAPKIWLPQGASLTANEGAGEVQTPFTYKANEHLRLGDPLILRHAKAGELFERFNYAWLIQPEGTGEKLPTYRGLGKHFL